MKTHITLILTLLLISHIHSQEIKQKKPVDFAVWDSWKSIENPIISNDGLWVSYEVKPYKGDGVLVLTCPSKSIKFDIQRGSRAIFSPGSKFIAYKTEAKSDLIRKLKFEKAKKEKFPKDSLYIRVLKTNQVYSFDRLRSFKMPAKKSDWIAIQQEKAEDVTEKPVKKPKDFPEVFDLSLFNPETNKVIVYKDVTEYSFSENGKSLGFIQVVFKNEIRSSVSVFNTENAEHSLIYEAKGLIKSLTLDSEGKQSAFISSADSTDIKMYSLFLWSRYPDNKSIEILGKSNKVLPEKWSVSEYRNIWFSKDGTKIYFGTAPLPEPSPKDTMLDEEKVNLDLWSWTDQLLQSQQLIELKKEQRRNYLTVYHINKKQTIKLADPYVQETTTVLSGNADFALGFADSLFQRQRSWSYPWFKDVYLIDVNSGYKKLVLEKFSYFIESDISSIEISPMGKYIFWYENLDSCWYSINTSSMEKTALTKKIPVNFYDEEFDRPSVPWSYNFAGWTENDKYFLVYDRYDIWKIDPVGIEKPVCITNGFGRKNKIEFRYVKVDNESQNINTEGNIILSAFNKSNKQGGYYTISVNKISDPVKLVMDNFEYTSLIKSKESRSMIWRKGSVAEYPDIWYSMNLFSNPLKISRANPQQDDYIWATAEMVRWKTFDGKEEEGILYKPENFDPQKKYPMIVTFYELRSDRLHTHAVPKPSRSPINMLEYASNGYLVFVPNIRYTVGNPGESAVNYVVSGTKAMIEKGFVDKDRIGIQGQSWGAYQVAYIVTQTNLYKAACAFSPVSNMTSAYGEIVWQYGYSRMSMYESAQSRLGTTLWEKPEVYVQNSPIFYADKIETPMMIVHNDGDGTVPWNQGIALFVALRRLNKPCWLLNYNGEPHNLRDKSPDSKDFSIRMFQFFNHYLNGKKEPVWMKDGIPAIKKGKALGYELNE